MTRPTDHPLKSYYDATPKRFAIRKLLRTFLPLTREALFCTFFTGVFVGLPIGLYLGSLS